MFVESVLRYGLPVNFQAAIIKPQKKGSKRLRDALDHLYSHLNSSNDISKKEVSISVLIETFNSHCLTDYIVFSFSLIQY